MYAQGSSVLNRVTKDPRISISRKLSLPLCLKGSRESAVMEECSKLHRGEGCQPAAVALGGGTQPLPS